LIIVPHRRCISTNNPNHTRCQIYCTLNSLYFCLDNGERLTIAGDYIVDIKGYGDQFADYSTGCLNVYSKTDSHDWGTSVEWTNFNNVAGDPYVCDGPGCGMWITQGSFTETEFESWNTTTLTGKNLVGAADMTTLGGLAACVEFSDGVDLPEYSGDLYQTQTVENLVSGSLCPDCQDVSGSAYYLGRQTLELNIGNGY
jgi:hypothetical protein